MKRQLLISILVLLSAAAALASQEAAGARADLSAFAFSGSVRDETSLYKAGELIVRFSDTGSQPALGGAGAPIVGPLTKRAIRSKISDYIVSGASVHKEYERLVPGLAIVKLPEGTLVVDALIRFNRSANILYAEPDYKIRASQPVIPNDPRFGEQWGLNNTGQTGGTPGADINAPEAWETSTNASNMIVAVLDTGINYTHPDLAANMWINPGEVRQPGVVGPNDVNGVDDDNNGFVDDIYGYDFNDNDGDPNDEHFHGTHVAGIIGAVGNNGIGVSGVCWKVKLMAVRVLGADGRGYVDNAIAGINYAVMMGADVINASWALGYQYSAALYNSIASAGTAGVLFVAAAGNDGYPFADYPAGYGALGLDNVISVMATDDFDVRASFSNYGSTDVDLGAPGENILSTLPTYQTPAMTANGLPTSYGIISGTSMAAPFVSGAYALTKAVAPPGSFTYAQIKAIILRSVDRVLPGQCVSGGRLNLFNAVSMVRPGVVLNVTKGIRYNTIQAAIDAANNGNRLIADANYWYFENVNFKGKKVTLRSGDVNNPPGYGVISPTTTYISGLFNPGYVVRLDSGEDASTILTGFTIIDGQAGSIHVLNSSPTITDCIITGNNGGIYCYNAPKPTITNCTITNNSQSSGGIYCHNSSPTITNCTIIANTTWNNGGGIYCDGGSDPKITNCTITGNTTDGQGGGIYSDETSDPNISNCTITLNRATWEGGGIYCISGSPKISDCNIGENVTEWDGGGIYCDGSEPNIRNNTIINNFAYYDGGGIYLNGASPPIKNCLIIGNAVDSWDCGGVFCWDASPTITNCTFAHNRSNNFDGVGGALYCLGTSNPKVTNCIFNDNNDIAIYEYDIASDPNVRWCLFYNNPQGDYFDRDTGTVVWANRSQPNNILCNMKHYNVSNTADSHNFSGNPMFVRGRLGSYYLSQFPAGQILDANGVPVNPSVNPKDANSPAVDAGSADANALGMHIYSTRTDNFKDAKGNKDFKRVDIGFHYNDPCLPRTYSLSASATNGTISPLSGNYTQYKQVLLQAAPADPAIYQFKSWAGTDNDASKQLWNIVTMDSNKFVSVVFERILVYLRTRVVGGNGTVTPRSGEYPRGTVVNLTATPANQAHRVRWTGSDNDYSTERANTVTMSPPFTSGSQGRDYKIVDVNFYEPRMLDVPGDYTNIQDAIEHANNGDIVLIAPGVYDIRESSLPYEYSYLFISGKAITISSVNPDDPSVVAATVIYNAGFVISNVNRDTVINGLTIQSAQYNVNTIWITPTGSGIDGPGGHIGDTSGGGMELLGSASPDVRNCRFVNCAVGGISGGNGNGGADVLGYGGQGGWPGAAYGGGVSVGQNGNPIFTNCIFSNCFARGGDGGNGANGGVGIPPGHGGGWGDPNAPWWWEYGPFEDYWKYSGYGGAVYCAANSFPEFVDCNFVNNHAYGGSCGISGTPIVISWPYRHYRIDSFGGAVYAAAGSTPVFTGCTFTNNEADVNGPATHRDGTAAVSDDPYISYGGAIAFEDGANPTFNSCSFSSNLATIGGGMWATWAEPNIVDCNFIQNTAYHGGGVYFVGDTAKITQSNFRENEALYDTSIADSNNPQEVLGEGGAIHCFDGNAVIVDCNVFNNDASYSGGGIYISGSNKSLVKNCLITGNSASRDGGGVSIDWHSDVNIVNCTIADNSSWGYGGGVYCSYNSYVNIIDSIIWDNIGIYGAQLAVATGYTYDPRPSTVDVSYSDVGVREVKYDLIDANGLPTIRPGFDTNLLAANDDQSTGLVDIGFNIDFFGRTSSQLYVNNNGNVTFDANMMTFTPFGLTGNIGTSIIAPFFADVDTRPGAIPTNALTRYGTGMVNGHAAFGVTWRDVGYFSMHWDKLNSFQLVLIDRSDRSPGDFDIEFNYEKIQWETGDASGGVNGLGGFSARAGFSNGTGNPGTFYEFEGSGVPGAFLDSRPTGLIHGSRRSAVNGRYIFAVQSGLPELLPTVPVYVGANCILDGWDWNSGTNNWKPNFVNYHNISENPFFIAGYYLSQFNANQPVESNCVDGGSDLASKVGLDKYTTRTDSVPDAGIVDMGYHYKLFTVPKYKLTINAVGVTVIEPVVYPPDYSRLYNWYTTVHLRINSSTYDPRYYQVLWTGTDDDSLSGPNNTVTMDGNKLVTVRLVKTNYDLTIGVNGGNGRLSARWVEGSSSYTIKDPCTHSVKFGAVVQLTAEPDKGYRVRRWSGTDNDTIRAPNNTVTVNSDRTVSVEFGPPVSVTVPGDYPTIWDAVSEVEVGDTIVVEPGTYYGGYEGVMVVVDKPVVIRSRNPDDPCCVAATIIDGYNGYRLNQGYNNIGIQFASTADANTVLNGFTIQNCGGYWGTSLDGSRTTAPNHPDGFDGGCGQGAAISIMPGAGPTIKNCVIRNNAVQAGNAGNGINADNTNNAGRGGWGGWAHGGAIYCGPASTVKFINCQIIGNLAQGGNGGNGGAYATNGGAGNYGGNWSINRGYNIPSTGLGIVYIDGNLWEVWQWDLAFSYWPMYDEPTRTSYFGDYRWYSGYGGGVYCDVNSTVDFNDCLISGNTAQGGMSGQGGVVGAGGRQQEPLIPYEIPSYGGGVYCAAGASITFTGCTITNNISSPPQYVVAGNPASGLRNRLDPYVGHGGGVCAENTASVAFNKCAFSGNEASLGAGTFWADANSIISDSNMVDNLAFNGGGIYLAHGLGEIVGSYFSGNDANGPVGAGGAVYCSDANVLITDCNIAHNDANSSGGGLYFTGSNTMSVKNCLIINNLAGRDGGGVSANWYANAVLANCTLAGNAAPGTFGEPGNTGLGGGLYASYESNTSVIDSIFWNNYALKGMEMGVGTGFEHDPRPAKLTVSYSDVRGGRFGVRVDTGCVLNWGAGNRDSDPLFVTGMFGDYYLSQTAVGDPNQTQNSPCVDAGSDYTGNVGMIRHVDPTGRIVAYTTRTDGELDHGKVDMGYHYRTVEPCRFCDLVYDGIINFLDYAVLAAHWLNSGCSDLNGWCGGADLTFDGVVNDDDSAFLMAECWMVEDTKAPIPNPSEWEIEPYLTSSSSIKMIARTAFDEWGWNVEYYFDCVYGNCHDRSWQQSRTYQDTGLARDARYGYRVKARDELDNETEWSVIRYAGLLDTIPPAPAPTWVVAPYAVGSASIAMEATVAYDDSGVSYGFWNVTRDPAGNNIVWQSGRQFTDVNLDPNTTYGYRVEARDGSHNQNETAWSVIAYATTLGAVDATPPTPNPAQWDLVLDANGYNGRPRKVNIGGGPDYYATMRAVQAVDPSGVEYRFVCANDSRFSSGWQNQPAFATPWTYTVPLGGVYVYTEWYVIVRDQSPNRNQTGPSETWPALVRAPP